MYVIIVYDISTQRVSKICQFLRQYLNWVQNSVFEGELTESELKKIEDEIKHIIDINEDSVIIYKLRTDKILEKKHIGIKKSDQSFII